MQAVYELLTVAPYMPPRAKFTRAELDVYVKGYERAIAQALKVMKPAAKRWEARLMRDYKPHLVDPAHPIPQDALDAEAALVRRILVVVYVIGIVGAVIVGEVLVLLAALIVRVLG